MPRYVVIRTDKSVKPFILRELEDGRLRQGWGWRPEHDLRLLREKVLRGGGLSDEEKSVWRNRRLLETEPDGLKPGDIAILPNLPEQGRWLLARITGPYSFDISNGANSNGPDYGHIVRVELVRDAAGKAAIVEPDNEHVDARLRATMRNLGRMWSVDALGAAVERLVEQIAKGVNVTVSQPETQKLSGFFDAMRDAAWKAIIARYHGAELEQLIRRLFERIYGDSARVEHWGGAGEKGADLIVFMRDALGLEYKIGVQVKLFDGVHDEPHALAQIHRARREHRIDAGVIVTTAERTSDAFERRRAEMEAELGIDVRIVARDELVELVMKHIGNRTDG